MEASLLDWFYRHLPPHRHLRIGPGDDAALVDWHDADACVVTVDVLMDGVDFELSRIDPRRAGHKALAVNLSDLAAMAAEPRAAVVGLVLPRQGGEALAHGLYAGLLPLAREFDVALAGGDINSWDGPLVISVTVLGAPPPRGVLKRSGAQPGDAILVTGQFGGSILGHHLDFQPRVQEALALHAQYDLHAAIDVSDGLSLDLARVAQASGCGFVLETSRVPIAEAAHQLAATDGRSPLDHALTDGEDFELILAVPGEVAKQLVQAQPLPVPLTHIGRFTAEPDYWQQDAAGQRRPLVPTGFEHRLT